MQIGEYCPFAKTNWDGQHQAHCVSKIVSQTKGCCGIVDLITLVCEFMFGSQMIAQFWTKILSEHNLGWIKLKTLVKHRFGSIAFPIDDLLKYYSLINEFVMQYEKIHKVIETFKIEWSSYCKQLDHFKRVQKQPLQKLSASKPETEAQRLLNNREPTPPTKSAFVIIYEYIRNEAAPFVAAIIGDYIDALRIYGQKLAPKNFIFCTTIVFLEEVEATLDFISLQTFEQPYSTRSRLVASKVSFSRVLSL